MKTDVFKPITTDKQAISYITDLFNNGEIYHFEDDAHEIEWATCLPNESEKDALNKRAHEMFEINGFDPFEISMNLINPEWNA